jgi:hypothetical protein
MHLLSLTQDIFNGFNMSKSTAAIFIDFEKAYDSVWREELMVKLSVASSANLQRSAVMLKC